MLTSLSASAVQGEQIYGPYGNQRYTAGTMGTAKGYTGQFHDNITGLDYYNARYYDPVAGVFTSPDSVQGNAQGMSPYQYVSGNPETMTDPTGHSQACGDGCGSGGDPGNGGGNPGGGPSCGGFPMGENGCQPPPSTKTPVSGTGDGCMWKGKPCDSNNNPCVGTVWNGKGCVDKPAPNANQCEKTAACSHNRQLLLNHLAALGNLWADFTALGSYIIALIEDWGEPAMWLDIASIVLQGALAIGDFASLNGNAPAWLSIAIHIGEAMVGAFNLVKGAIGLLGGLNEFLDSFSSAKGVFQMASEDIKDFELAGFANIFGGGTSIIAGGFGLAEDWLNSLSPQDMQNKCFAWHLDSCQN